MPKNKAKQYRVTMTAYAEIIVTADNDEEAHEIAREEISRGDFEIDEQDAKEVAAELLNSTLRHADCVSYDLNEAQRYARGNPFKSIPKSLLKKGD